MRKSDVALRVIALALVENRGGVTTGHEREFWNGPGIVRC